MDGFGSSAFAIGKEVYVTTYNGVLTRTARPALRAEVEHVDPRRRTTDAKPDEPFLPRAGNSFAVELSSRIIDSNNSLRYSNQLVMGYDLSP